MSVPNTGGLLIPYVETGTRFPILITEHRYYAAFVFFVAYRASMMAVVEGELIRSEYCGASNVCCNVDVDLDGVRVIDSFMWDMHSEARFFFF